MNEQQGKKHQCESCSMPIDNGRYCQYCVDESGALQAFDERLARMMQWTKRNEPELPDEQAELRTLEFMATMPAWQNHEQLKSRLAALKS